MYLDQDNIPFYVGKGKNVRYYVSAHLGKRCPNLFLKNKIRKISVENVKIQFLHKNLTEEGAFRQERYWIKYYGRRDLGTGTLCNLTDGGEGSTGHVCSDEAKLKMSENNRWKGKPGPMANKLHSKTTKEKMCGPRKPYGSQTEEHKHKVKRILCGVNLFLKSINKRLVKLLKGKSWAHNLGNVKGRTVRHIKDIKFLKKSKEK